MDSARFPSETGVLVTRVAENQWHAVDDGRVVGRGDTTHRPDGRVFLSIDSWHDTVFDLLADAMLADLGAPLYTVVDEADRELTARWQRAGFTIRRREWEYLVPTDPEVTKLPEAPPDVTVVGVGAAEERLLRELDRVIRDEVETSVGWREMPAEILPRQAVHPSKYAVAAHAGRYVGLLRIAMATRQPRIGLVAVRTGQRRRGIARALLGHVLGTLHRNGIESAWAEVNESNEAAIALFEGLGAQLMSSNIELTGGRRVLCHADQAASK
ncbi:GNAT family N-acetyltransferase [Kibdelosporangium phytohabitans]|uniref:GCN5 family acetyltransferase n=1 Tax=Kibdelosporangium phytohabitans TaxID=860235 RepID=A0A0N9I2R3_9PSEU|nr:GNAT family N-acetyltransferase [Kibdelosporangium phytohabitans]ALG12033.1 GCN5 family acetyltransferase [Kibdelosporangium phytohabitans]MBE1463511.1 ribosomal protein S18 acetylase RimI-like enzyme [Kibdelosporangium phytohabitans]